jgi:ribosome assembly protein YihI (activator of Der GTPase)
MKSKQRRVEADAHAAAQRRRKRTREEKGGEERRREEKRRAEEQKSKQQKSDIEIYDDSGSCSLQASVTASPFDIPIILTEIVKSPCLRRNLGDLFTSTVHITW